MDVFVASRDELIEWISSDKIPGSKRALISISSPSSRMKIKYPKIKYLEEMAKKHFLLSLFLFFDDVEEFEGDPGAKPFDHDQAKLVLDFLDMVDKNRCDTIICQCEAGISRSSAIAAFILLREEVKNGKNVRKNWERRLRKLAKNAKRPLFPNMLVFRVLLEESSLPIFSIPLTISDE